MLGWEKAVQVLDCERRQCQVTDTMRAHVSVTRSLRQVAVVMQEDDVTQHVQTRQKTFTLRKREKNYDTK